MKFSRIFLGAAVVCAGLTSCEGVVEDLNTDPNEFTDISTALITNSAVLNLVVISEAEPARIGGMWTDQFTGSDRQYITQDNYGVNNADFDATWADLYRGGISSARIAREKAVESSNAAIEGIAQILEGHYAAEAALLFGDVPFSQAGDANEFPDPVYDPQRDVLNAALNLLEQGGGKTGDVSVSAANNVLTSGAGTTFGQFADALRARYMLAMQNYDGALSAARDAGFTDPAGSSVDIIHTTTRFAENLYYQFEVQERTDYLTFTDSYLQNVLSDTADVSRADDKTDDSARVDYYMFRDPDFVRLNTNPGGLFDAGRDWPVIGYPEVQLIIAECEARDGNRGAAIEALNNARNYWDLQTGTNSYEDYEDGDDGLNGDDLLKTILLEKFVSVFGLPTFYDVIRTENLIGTDLDGRSTPVQRFLYPSTEQASNSNFPGVIDLDVPTPIFN